jgi:hypothetical protein
MSRRMVWLLLFLPRIAVTCLLAIVSPAVWVFTGKNLINSLSEGAWLEWPL